MLKKIKNLFSGRRAFAEDVPVNTIILKEKEFGSTGTEIYSGYIQEDYLSTLTGTEAMDTFDKMRRSDTQIKLALSSVINSIMGANWDVEYKCDEEDKDKDIEKFIKYCIFKGANKSWSMHLREILSCCVYGYSLFEIVHKIIKDHPEYYDKVGLKYLAYRSQRTINTWTIDKDTKELKSIRQFANGDLNAYVEIPAENVALFTIDREGDNFEGISLLRSCYGCWYRKNNYLKLMAIGIEKTAIGTPVGKYPDAMYNTPEYIRFEDVLRSLVAHQQNFVTLPQGKEGQGWNIDIVKSEFDAQKVKDAIDYEDQSIVRNFLAQFLMLGSGSTGSWSLSTDQSDFFLNGITYIADIICEVINNRVIIPLVDANFGKQEHYPELFYSGIRDRAGKEFAEVLQILSNSKIIVADDNLEKFTRKKYDLPEKGLEGQRINQPLVPGQQPQAQPDNKQPSQENIQDEQKDPDTMSPEMQKDMMNPEKEAPDEEMECEKTKMELSEIKKSLNIKLADPRKQIRMYSDKLKNVYKIYLPGIRNNMVDQVISNYEDANNTNKVMAAKNIEPKGLKEYQSALYDSLAEAALAAQAQAAKEAKIKFAEIKFAKKTDKALLPKTAKYLAMMAATISEKQASDLKSAIALQFGSSLGSTNDPKIIKNDININTDKIIDKTEAATDTVLSDTVNKARFNLFYDEDVIDEIESFTFKNDDPKTQICQELNGQTFSSDDIEALRMHPPLHYNCMTYLVPNIRGSKNNPESKTISVTKKAQAQINLSECTCGFARRQKK